ncbi:MAG: hypothetical protein IJM68_00535 [Synergistaceae bacterium]|nr:hypothetical protein [Synergistaceae bacterium]
MAAKKVFISMPMVGKSKEEILQAQHDVLVSVGNELNEEVEQVDSYLDQELSPLGCLGESLKKMATADYVAFAAGWENARGCKIERICAEAYGIPCIDMTKI